MGLCFFSIHNKFSIFFLREWWKKNQKFIGQLRKAMIVKKKFGIFAELFRVYKSTLIKDFQYLFRSGN